MTSAALESSEAGGPHPAAAGTPGDVPRRAGAGRGHEQAPPGSRIVPGPTAAPMGDLSPVVQWMHGVLGNGEIPHLWTVASNAVLVCQQAGRMGVDIAGARFTAGGDAVTPPFIGRPFIDATTGLNAVEDVSFPGIQGNVTVDADSEFQSGGVWFRRSLCSAAGCQDSCCDDITCDSCVDCGTGVNGCGSGLCSRWSSRCGRLFNRGTRRIDFLFGLRSTRLDENLNISEDLQTTDIVPTTFQVSDRFSTTNEFTGFELGYVWGWQNQRWSIDLLNRIAIGGTRQQVDIRGSTVQDTGAGPVTGPGGLLALPSNIGSYSRDELSVIPEFGATLGFALTKRLRLTAGYTFIYWSRVARPGDQIDLEVNPGSLPFATTPSTIPARPQFVFRDTDIWIQGLNFGADYTW